MNVQFPCDMNADRLPRPNIFKRLVLMMFGRPFLISCGTQRIGGYVYKGVIYITKELAP